MALKPYQAIAISDCGEPLVAIPRDRFAFVSPHPYQKAGAPYGDRSPFYLRQGVLDRLTQVQQQLTAIAPGWRLQLFDAYRPVAVQAYMVNYSFEELLAQDGLDRDSLSPEQRDAYWTRVYQFWARPSGDPATPPPHSTGAAIDLSLVDAEGQPLDMGSPIDEISDRSFPNYFADRSDSQSQGYHHNRQRLGDLMAQAGFRRHQNEWWHFSYGDQYWTWLGHEAGDRTVRSAIYGSALFSRG
jgi:zinc D-Ala-D-Ala dipeptidase